jgi:hypothetical protein
MARDVPAEQERTMGPKSEGKAYSWITQLKGESQGSLGGRAGEPKEISRESRPWIDTVAAL